MKLIISAGLLCAIAISCTNNETKKDETMTADTSTEKMATEPKMEAATPAPVDSATMMKNWQAYATPGEPHKLMASWDGTWEGEVTMWHSPEAPPEKSKSTSKNKMIMDGRYQLSNYSGNMMGMPFEGMSLMGYDNAKKVFTSTWIDNMGTGLMKMEGPWDEANKSITLTGKCVDPSRMDGTEMQLREVFKIVDDKTQIMEMYGPGPDGKEFKMMEIKMTKK